MQNQRDQRDYQQNVYQPAGDVENRPPHDPCDQKDHKQDCENAHMAPPKWLEVLPRRRLG